MSGSQVTISDFFCVEDLRDVFVVAELTEFVGNLPTRATIIRARHEGQPVQIPAEQARRIAGTLLFQAQKAHAPDNEDDFEPDLGRDEDSRARWGMD